MQKYNFSDVAFTIPYHAENSSRANNLRIVIEFLQYHLETNIIIIESGDVRTADFPGCETIFVPTNKRIFHKTFLLNVGILSAKQNIIISYDADILLPISQLLKARRIIDKHPFCFPYATGLVNIDKLQIANIRTPQDSHNIFPKLIPKVEYVPDGGCFMFNKSEFIKAGMENEYFLNYSLEDAERKTRLRILGYDIKFVDGYIYHLEHTKSSVSTWENQFYKQGRALYDRVNVMDKKQMEDYVKAFAWTKRKLKDLTEQ